MYWCKKVLLNIYISQCTLFQGSHNRKNKAQTPSISDRKRDKDILKVTSGSSKKSPEQIHDRAKTTPQKSTKEDPHRSPMSSSKKSKKEKWMLANPEKSRAGISCRSDSKSSSRHSDSGRRDECTTPAKSNRQEIAAQLCTPVRRAEHSVVTATQQSFSDVSFTPPLLPVARANLMDQCLRDSSMNNILELVPPGETLESDNRNSQKRRGAPKVISVSINLNIGVKLHFLLAH